MKLISLGIWDDFLHFLVITAVKNYKKSNKINMNDLSGYNEGEVISKWAGGGQMRVVGLSPKNRDTEFSLISIKEA